MDISDLLYAETSVSGGAEYFADTERAVNVDGHRLFPIVKLYHMNDASPHPHGRG